MPCFAITAAAISLRSTMEAAVCFCAGSSGIGVVLAQINVAPVRRSRVMICSSRRA
jgi:hypothetical protein